MSIQLLSVSHKTAQISIRSCFALTKQQQIHLMKKICAESAASECIVLSTCNRLEIYTYGPDKWARDIFHKVQQALFDEIKLLETADASSYLRFYQEGKAVRHLFLVASGLDSMIIGEDQILGQVKEAQKQAMKEGVCGAYLNTLFRYAITAAKKVKTETNLSKTPVSTATIAIKAAKEYLGSLKGKNIMLIGASGKIGSTVFKNLLSENEANVFVTLRKSPCHSDKNGVYKTIDYEERYGLLDSMDVVFSATKSPHYTLTKDRVKIHIKTEKPRVFIDLAVPQDIEESVRELAGAGYYNIDDFERVAGENNKKKEKEAAAAEDILNEYRVAFEKWMLFQLSLHNIRRTEGMMLKEAGEKGMEKAIDHFFFQIREVSNPEELAKFMMLIERVAKKQE